MTKRNTRRGFTLIELLVVVLIIGILAAIALPQYNLAVAKSRYIQAMTLANSFWQSAQRYYLENNIWPANIDVLDIQMPAGGRWNEQHTLITFPWGRCSVRASSDTNGYSFCTILNNDVVAYREFRNKDHVCRVYNNSALGHKVCQHMGGINPREISTANDNYISYTIQRPTP